MAQPPSKDINQGDNTFIREVDDALRRSNLEDFVRRYGWWILGGLIVVLLAWAAYIYWHGRQDQAAGRLAESYVQAFDKLENGPEGARADEALTTFETLAEQGTPGYRAAARMMQANILAVRGENAKALDLYGKVAVAEDNPRPLRDLALLRATFLEIDDLKPDDLIERLEPLAKPGAPFFGTAGELSALAMMKAGREDEAGELFSEIARSDEVPDEIRRRAALMANQLGLDLDMEALKSASAGGAIQQSDSPEAAKASN